MRSLVLSIAAVALLSLSPVRAESGAGWMGIVIGETRAAVEDPEDPRPAAVRVAGVFEGSPAEAAGLRAKDWILAIDGFPVASPGDLTGRVRDLGEDARVQILLERAGRERTICKRQGWLLRPEGARRAASSSASTASSGTGSGRKRRTLRRVLERFEQFHGFLSRGPTKGAV